ncbi:MAG TPA: VWA domain-containing protein, partial [Burkholderiales bacterium]|nr:VWA domain-containing protein [Burkholderiales bacterium]
GSDRVLGALQALDIAGVQRREDFYWTLAAVFLSRREQFDVFDQAFRVFWDRRGTGPAVPAAAAPAGTDAGAQELGGRVAEALALTGSAPRDRDQPGKPHVAAAASDTERLRRQDFASMSLDELAQAKKLVANLHLPIPEIRMRRMAPDPQGLKVDLRATLRASLRGYADIIPLRTRANRRHPPPLVILCDVSGSMSRYSRMLLHFLHAVTNDRDRVHTFVFGTRLTNITRHLRHRDVDIALDAVAQAVADWSGGTRIGAALKEFNLRWSRRVLAQNAAVLLITDGLDREGARGLAAEMERLRKSCGRLLWLNPLLRYRDFQPLAAGVRAMLPHVDAFLPAHDIDSLASLGAALSEARRKTRNRREPAWT